MPNKVIVVDSSYKKLLQEIRQGIKDVQINIERQKVLASWKMGQSIDLYISKVAPNSKSSSIPNQLAVDLNISSRVIRACIQFYRVYPQLEVSLPISWSHYRGLVSIDSLQERKIWEQRIVKESLSFDMFWELLQESREQIKAIEKKRKLQGIRRGLLYHYRLISVDYVNDSPESIMVDLGFKLRMQPPECMGDLFNKRIVRIDKKNGVYSLKLTGELVDSVYTYIAIVERVVDGDTLLVNIDCGFGVWSKQYLRLKGIDAPEINSVEGKRSKRFVEGELAKCPFVIVKTNKRDKYDRYLSDVFYSSEIKNPHEVAADGACLNQVLLDEGCAGIWRGK